MILAVDVGTSEFRSLFRQGGRLVGRRCAACYIAVPRDAVTDKWIARLKIRTLECDGSWIVFGSTAAELSRVLRVPLSPLLVEGRIPVSDPIGRQLLAVGLESILPPRTRFDEVLMTLPGDQVDPDEPEVALLTRLFRIRGPSVRLAHSGTAMAHARLSRHRYTGLVLNVGAAFCSASLVRLGQPLVEMTVAVGGRWIDDRFARTRSRFFFDDAGRKILDLFGVESWKRTVDLRSETSGNADLAVLRDLYREVAVALGTKIEQELSTSRHAKKIVRPVPVILSGGGATMGGFDDLLRIELQRIAVPFPLGAIELAGHDPFAVAKGLLIARETGNAGILRRAA